jgi:putative methyltransferase (TIGR04325 family)
VPKSESALASLRQFVRQPGSAVRRLIDYHHDRNFERWPGAYRGVYASFAEARASVPQQKLGFDLEAPGLYRDRLDSVFPSDYPVLFWLTRALRDASSVFDFGGHVGVSFYAYRKYLDFPPNLRWRVSDLPGIAEEGRQLAAERGERALSFTDKFSDADGFEILLAAGSLQFVETPFGAALHGLVTKPRHILINKLPLYDGEPFVTVQNTVRSFNPCRVDDRQQFIDAVLAEGYELVDQWRNADLSCRIPLHPERSIAAYTGLYFRRLTPR